MRIYVDTSALLKRFVAEAQSDRFDQFVMQSSESDELTLSPLCLTEAVSALKRRERMGELDANYVLSAWGQLQQEVSAGLWMMTPFPALAFAKACEAMLALTTPLAALDALHLATAQLCNCQAMASADARLCEAAHQAGLQVHRFDS